MGGNGIFGLERCVGFGPVAMLGKDLSGGGNNKIKNA